MGSGELDSPAKSTVGHEIKSVVHIKFKNNEKSKTAKLTAPHLCYGRALLREAPVL